MNGVRINGNLIEIEGEFKIGDELAVGDQVFRLQAINKATGQPVPKTGESTFRPASVTPSVQPHQLSGDIPVALPEEEDDFSVEETGANLRRSASHDASDDEIIQVSDLDFLDEDEDD